VLTALFFVMLVPSILWANRHQAALRGTDGQDVVAPPDS
jgi:hypothetical protein